MPDLIRAFILGLLILLTLWLGFKRERYLLIIGDKNLPEFVRKTPRVKATDYRSEMQSAGKSRFSPKMSSAILYSLSYTILTSLIIGIGYRRRSYAYFTAALYLSYMALSGLLLFAGSRGASYSLSIGLSHNLEDLFLSPFVLMLLAGFLFVERRLSRGR